MVRARGAKGRRCCPLANSVLFLASDQASLTTGQTLYVEGGATFN
ncbi:SDR family NAD(P)-dependent oxidoreductase [Paracoccus suum]|uniref:SDR family NAD(P)-dependent oxidoreductase n=1 Tax=Paracoccus suum TaxID=2259340 RepID=A0A344PLG7_9RHOB|nr:SDR family NAD(P)-dependent oxidoreductase [Paracoccus suum]